MGRAQELFYRASSDFLKVFFILIAARSAMLLGNMPIILIPILDDILRSIWYEMGSQIRALSNSDLLPRL